LQVLNCIVSPILTCELGLTAQRAAWTPLNFALASVWRYRLAAAPRR
jgi:hypothetical protein